VSVRPDLANPFRRSDGGSRKGKEYIGRRKRRRKKKDQVGSAENRRISSRNIDRLQTIEYKKKGEE
jgi:hypothetical protein